MTTRYEAWIRARDQEAEVIDTSDLTLLIDWKLGYGNGRLDEWTTDELEEFLLEPLTQAMLDEMVAEFTARPFEERKALTDSALEHATLHDADLDLPALGPVRLPDDAVRASASAAPVLAGFTSLAEYFRAPGRPLTAKGNIRLADAEALSGILGTEGRLLAIGEATFTRRSATEMPHLDHWQWWAREAGALRVRSGRLLGGEAWLRRRAKDPVSEARKACDVLLAFGALDSFVTRYRDPVYDLLDTMTPPLLGMLLSADAPVEFSDMVDAVGHVHETTGGRSPFDDLGWKRRSIRRGLDTLLMLLERAGLIEQHDLTDEPTEFAQQRTGGTVTLTPFGLVTAVDYVRASGVDVITVGDPARMSAEDVAGLAADQLIGPDEWAAILAEWVPSQADRRAALRDVLDALGAADALVVAMLLPVPSHLEPDYAAVLEAVVEKHGPDEVLGAVALTWLADHGRIDPERLAPDVMLMSGLTTLALIARTDPESVPEAMGTQRPRQDHIDLIKEAARRMPPDVEALLDAVARHFPDAAVATAARKELMRVRSRLARGGRQRR